MPALQARAHQCRHAGVRVGGSSGVAQIFFGNWAELGEATVDLEVLACDSCGHVELRLPEKDRDRLAERGAD